MTSLIDLAWTQAWQVTIVAAGVGLLTRLWCRRRPHLAYALWLVVLLKCLTPPVWSSPTSVFSWAAHDSATPIAIAHVPVKPATGIPPVMQSHQATHRDIPGGGESSSVTDVPGAHDAVTDPPSGSAANPGARLATVTVASVLAITWLIGASAYAGYAFLATICCWRTIRTSRIPTDERLTKLALNLSRRLGIRRAVRVWVAGEPLGPLTFGSVWPTIVIPEALAAHRSTDELEPLLAHELVHVRRFDAFVGLLQLTARCLWWFHPLIWWASRRIDFERERCCDEAVVADLSLDPGRYARGLLSVLELKRQLRWLPASPGTRPFEITQQRLEHIVLRGNRFRKTSFSRDCLTLIVGALLLLPGAGLTGQSSRGAASSPREPQTIALREQQQKTDASKPQRFDPAEVEMHVVAAGGANRGDMRRVDVLVRPTAKPVVLVLTSYSEADWYVTLAPGARIKKLIVSGYFTQEIKELPADVPFVNQSYFPADGSRRKDGWFYPGSWNTPMWREMVRRLNEMTGLPVASFQDDSDGRSFIVDGNLGRNFGQNGLKLRARGSKSLTPRELLMASVNSELHVVGVYSGNYTPDRNRAGKPLEVEVRSTTKPVLLVLTSYAEAVWNIRLAEGARLKAVIVGGGMPQEVEGIPADVPVYYFCPDGPSFYFDRRNPAHDGESFFAYQWNTLESRRMVEKLNDLTGLLVSTFQGEYSGTSFIVDGGRGRNFAQKERKARPTLPEEPTPRELLATSADADLHAISIYGTEVGNGTPVDVEIRPTTKPIVLALASYQSVLWNVKLAQGARVKAVIIGGYFEQEFEGIPATIPIIYRAYWPSRSEGFFYAYKWGTNESSSMVEKLNDLTGLLVSTFQVEASGTSFVVDGARGGNHAQKERRVDGTKARDSAGQQAQNREDPLADVADIPSQQLHAGGDSSKRFMLIGPKKNAKPRSEGFGLVVIMPGGDGSAEFHPFVKRIYKNALSDQYLAAQPIAKKWTPDQKIVWPTKANPVAGMKFATEEFVEAVIQDVAQKHKLDRTKVFSLSWSSSGPAAYAISLQEKHSVTGSFVAMSVFYPELLPPLKNASGHAYYLYHSEQDRVCKFPMAEQARTSLAKYGAKVHLETYEGGHGWRGNVYGDIRKGIGWLAENQAKAGNR